MLERRELFFWLVTPTGEAAWNLDTVVTEQLHELFRDLVLTHEKILAALEFGPEIDGSALLIKEFLPKKKDFITAGKRHMEVQRKIRRAAIRCQRHQQQRAGACTRSCHTPSAEAHRPEADRIERH